MTINPTNFASCRGYASVLTSCAAATPSFHPLEYDTQASCVCYQPSTNTAACQAVPTLDTTYDDYKFGCYDFFNAHGYKRIAQAVNDSIVLPGQDLCDVAKSVYTVPSTLPAKTVSCAVATPAAVQVQEVDQAGARGLLMAFDRGIFVVFSS